jgi:(p)ppGpp synthase/HD superfamily hydrolase
VFDADTLGLVEIVERARLFALDRYDSPDELEHPEEVRGLVAAVGAGGDVQAAALLHDVVEDTDTTAQDIYDEFGSPIGDWVSALTEDELIADYFQRKDEHRRRARDAGREVALLFVADKLSNARRMKRGKKKVKARKLGHYAATAKTMRTAYPDLPLIDDLEAELASVHTALQTSAA